MVTCMSIHVEGVHVGSMQPVCGLQLVGEVSDTTRQTQSAGWGDGISAMQRQVHSLQDPKVTAIHIVVMQPNGNVEVCMQSETQDVFSMG